MQESEAQLEKLELEYLTLQASNANDSPQTCQLCYDHEDTCSMLSFLIFKRILSMWTSTLWTMPRSVGIHALD